MRRSLIVILCAAFSPQAVADVTIYTAVSRKNATFAQINNNQWRIDPDGQSSNENPAMLSTTKQCKVSFVVLGVGSQPQFPDPVQGAVQNMPQGTTATYTPQFGAGHWSINGPNNNIGFPNLITQYVIDNPVVSVNADYAGKSPSKCQRPTAPNFVSRTKKRYPVPRRRPAAS